MEAQHLRHALSDRAFARSRGAVDGDDGDERHAQFVNRNFQPALAWRLQRHAEVAGQSCSLTLEFDGGEALVAAGSGPEGFIRRCGTAMIGDGKCSPVDGLRGGFHADNYMRRLASTKREIHEVRRRNSVKYAGNVLLTHAGSLIRTGVPPNAASEKHIAMR